GRQAGEVHLNRGEGDRLAVAQYADVELAALDVLLDQRGVADLLVDGADAVHHLGGASPDGFAVDPDPGVHAQRPYQPGQAQVAAGLQIGVEREDGEVREEDVVEGQELLGEDLVLLEVEFPRTASGIGDSQQVEQPRGPDGTELPGSERLQQVEEQVGLAPPD